MNVNEKLKIGLGGLENIVGKGENAGDQHFLLFPQCFQNASFSRSLKVGTLWQRVKSFADDKILALSKFQAFAKQQFQCDSNCLLIWQKTLRDKGGNAGCI